MYIGVIGQLGVSFLKAYNNKGPERMDISNVKFVLTGVQFLLVVVSLSFIFLPLQVHLVLERPHCVVNY